MRADDVYQTSVIFKPSVCGTRTIVVVATDGGTQTVTGTTSVEVTRRASAFALYATERVVVGLNSSVSGGNIGVRDPHGEATIGRDVVLGDGVSIFADSVKIRTEASVDDIYFNVLQANDQATIRGQTFTPLTVPLATVPPLFPSPAPGDRDVHVIPEHTVTIPPGAHGAIAVSERATLVLLGGIYQIDSLAIGV